MQLKVVTITIVVTLLVAQQASSAQTGDAVANQQAASNSTGENQTSFNEIENNDDDQRIIIVEPYKSLLQTTTRFALAQTQVTQHMNIDTAMNLLNQIAYSLAKPIILLRVIKSIVVLLASLMTTAFFFPGAQKFLEAVWRDPNEAFQLDRYMRNGIQGRSVLAAIGSSTEETLNRVGLQDYSCRERSLCYIGEILKCSFPDSSEKVTNFVTENLSSSAGKENVYARAFVSGFVDRNCTLVGLTNPNETKNCLGDFFHSIFIGGSSKSKRSSSSHSGKKRK